MTWSENKRVVVTGATSGIGREVATALAALGAHVVLACRDQMRGEAVASEINGTAGAERATVMTVDTSDQSSIRAFARRYRGGMYVRPCSTSCPTSRDTPRFRPRAGTDACFCTPAKLMG